jgi:D-sedoheptulose 7-phosphate isomerase
LHNNTFSHFLESKDLLEKVIADKDFEAAIEDAVNAFSTILLAGNKIIACGNGGSMSDAMHFAEELSGRFRENRKPLAAIAISDPGYLSCVANDFGFAEVFARFVEGLGKPGDALLAISTSGRSENVVKAAHIARKLGITVISLTGNDGGRLAAESDIHINVPFTGYADHIQEIHIMAIHAIIKGVESRLFA